MSISLQGSTRSFRAAAAARTSRDAVYRAVWRWHFYAGLACLPFLISLSATGALYLFQPEINATAFAYRTRVAAPSTAPLGPDRLIFNAAQAVPGGTPVAYTDPADATASAIRGSTSAPSTSSSSRLPARGGGSPAHQSPSAGGSHARRQPCRSSGL